MDFADIFVRVSDQYTILIAETKTYKDRADQLNKRKRDDCTKYLDESSRYLGEISLISVELRGLSWEAYKALRHAPGGSSTRALHNLRQEVKDMLYTLTQVNSSILEISRTVRAFLQY